jgi:proteasome alpha subunit
MTTPFYVPQEQVMKDKAEYARKGIARGRSVVVLQYVDGVLFVAENLSRALHKISENLRQAGIRLADTRGYLYDRRDVTGRGLANAYAQTLGTIFTESSKPFEVEIVVAEVGDEAEGDQIYRLTYDGSVSDEHGFVAMGGQAEQISSALEQHYSDGQPLGDMLRLAVDVLGTHGGQPGSPPRQLEANQLEVAVLDRTRPLRKFRRIVGPALEQIMTPAEQAQG